MAERIGVFGGTFDPIHVGHLVAAVNVRYALALDRVLLVVANIPWQKADRRSVTPAEDRLALVEAAVEGVAGLEASRIELDRGGMSYTADTLTELAGAHPSAELFLIVGADIVGELGSWERVDVVRQLATLVVVNRPGPPRAVPLGPGWRVREVQVPNLDISSSDLRARAIDGRPLNFLVPDATMRCIRARNLYADIR